MLNSFLLRATNKTEKRLPLMRVLDNGRETKEIEAKKEGEKIKYK